MAKYATKFRGTRKAAAAASALRKAATIIRSRSSGLAGMPRTGGFHGNYVQFHRGGGGRKSYTELKYIDTAVTGSAITNSGAVTFLNGVAQGTDYTNRIGRKVIIKSILANFLFWPSLLQSDKGDCVRFLCVYDTQTNSGSAPAVTDILATADVNSPMNLNNRDRFHIIFDKRITMGAAAYTAGAFVSGAIFQKHTSLYKKCAKDVIFSGTGATIGSVQTGAIHLLTIAKNNTVTSMDCYFRFRFLDS